MYVVFDKYNVTEFLTSRSTLTNLKSTDPNLPSAAVSEPSRLFSLRLATLFQFNKKRNIFYSYFYYATDLKVMLILIKPK